MALHSKLGASSYYRWRECPGSVKKCEGIESVSSEYAKEGTLAHDIAANILLGNGPKDPVPPEMAEAVTIYLDFVGQLRDKKPDFEAVEQKLNLTKYHPELFGTADYICYFKDKKILHVVDYKHGAGIPVEVERSTQLMYYGLGALHVNAFPIEKIVLTIVQPRCYHPDGAIRSWETDPIDMIEFAAQLIDDAKATERPNAPLKAGDHCRFCPAQPTCEAVESHALQTVTSGFTDVTRYDPDKLAKTLAVLPRIESWCKSVREFAYQEAMNGNVPPGFKLVDKRASRKWVENFDPRNWRAGFGGLFEDDFYEKKLKSVPQIDKMLKKPDKFLLEQYTVKESSGKNLVPVNDDRPAIAVGPETMFENEGN